MRANTNELELFEMHEKNEEWFSNHFEQLRKKHEDKFVAIRNQSLLATEDKIEVLLAQLEQSGIDTNEVFITSIPPEGMASIL